MIPIGRDLVNTYVEHKDLIQSRLGWLLWGDQIDENTRKDRMKGFFNRLENQGTLHGHYKQFNIPKTMATDAAHLNVRLPDTCGLKRFRLSTYLEIQDARTDWLTRKLHRMADLIMQSGERQRPKATLRSYCNQECEGISRDTFNM